MPKSRPQSSSRRLAIWLPIRNHTTRKVRGFSKSRQAQRGCDDQCRNPGVRFVTVGIVTGYVAQHNRTLMAELEVLAERDGSNALSLYRPQTNGFTRAGSSTGDGLSASCGSRLVRRNLDEKLGLHVGKCGAVEDRQHRLLRLLRIVVPLGERFRRDQPGERVHRGRKVVEGYLAPHPGLLLEYGDHRTEQGPAHGVLVPRIDLESVRVSGVGAAAP